MKVSNFKVNLTSKNHYKKNILHIYFPPNNRQDIRKNITNESRWGQVSRIIIYIKKAPKKTQDLHQMIN